MTKFDIFRLNLPISISGLGVGIDDCFVYSTWLNLWLNCLLAIILHFSHELFYKLGNFYLRDN